MLQSLLILIVITLSEANKVGTIEVDKGNIAETHSRKLLWGFTSWKKWKSWKSRKVFNNKWNKWNKFRRPTPRPVYRPKITPRPTQRPIFIPRPTPEPTFGRRPTFRFVPTLRPTTLQPSISPTFNDCKINFKIDIILIIDDSCGLTEQQCSIQNEFIIKLIQNFNDFNNVRLGLVTYTDIGNSIILLNNTIFDDLNESQALYSFIRGTTCQRSDTNSFDGLLEAINMFENLSEQNTAKTIVMINNCQEDLEINKICANNGANIENILKTNDIEILLINSGNSLINGVPCDYRPYNCIENDRVCVRQFSNEGYSNEIEEVILNICTTQTPTTKPTNTPQISESKEEYEAKKETQIKDKLKNININLTIPKSYVIIIGVTILSLIIIAFLYIIIKKCCFQNKYQKYRKIDEKIQQTNDDANENDAIIENNQSIDIQ